MILGVGKSRDETLKVICFNTSPGFNQSNWWVSPRVENYPTNYQRLILKLDD